MDRKIQKVLNKYGKKIVTTLKREVRIDKTVASGDTVDSIKYKRNGNSLVISYDATLGVLNDGLRPNGSFPSSETILQWMIDKNIRPRDSRKGSNRFTKGGSDSRNMKASAFLIARAINKKGTIKRFGYRGTGILEYINKKSDISKEFTKELQGIVEEEFDILFKQAKPLPTR